MPQISRFFDDVNFSASGTEISGFVGGVKNSISGSVNQIILTLVSGAATQADVEIRYVQGNGMNYRLVYQFLSAGLPEFVDSNINAPFSLKKHNFYDANLSLNDLVLFIQPDVSCVLDIRIDLEINT